MLFTLACGCDVTGSVNGTCQQYGGQCHCKAGVTGRACDQCIAGFYNFSSQGCSGTCNQDLLQTIRLCMNNCMVW